MPSQMSRHTSNSLPINWGWPTDSLINVIFKQCWAGTCHDVTIDLCAIFAPSCARISFVGVGCFRNVNCACFNVTQFPKLFVSIWA